MKRCTRCLMPDSVPGIQLSSDGVCNVCQYGIRKPALKGEDNLKKDLANFSDTKGAYDCIVAVSGGLDSIYAAYYLTKRMGIRCLGVNYDNSVSSDTSSVALEWLQDSLGVPVISKKCSKEQTFEQIRNSVRSLLDFGPQYIQIGFCQHCGYGARTAIYNEMIRRNLNAVKGSNIYEHIPFRYCLKLNPVRYFFQSNWKSAIKAVRDRYRQASSLRCLGMSPLRCQLSENAYPRLNSPLKTLALFDYVPWNRSKMLDEINEAGLERRTFEKTHSDCRIAQLIDFILRAAFTVGKKEVETCNRIRHGVINKEEGLTIIEEIREEKPDTSVLIELGFTDSEITKMLSPPKDQYRLSKTPAVLNNAGGGK